MLTSLRISQIGVIEDTQLDFEEGFNALTGETGAGKTMVITGLDLLLGARLNTTRAGASSTVEGRLLVQPGSSFERALDEIGAEIEDGEVLCVRRITKDGRSRAQIGGVSVPVSTLGKILAEEITVHGQTDQLRLKSPAAQLAALDRFGGKQLLDLREKHREKYQLITAIRKEKTQLEALLSERDQRQQLLGSALERIGELDIDSAQFESLKVEQNRLANAQDLGIATTTISTALSGDTGYEQSSVLGLLDVAESQATVLSKLDPASHDILSRVQSLKLELQDLAGEVARYQDNIEIAPGRLEEINQTLHRVNTLVRDLGMLYPEITDIDTMNEWSRSAAQEIDTLAGLDERLNQLEDEISVHELQRAELAQKLSAERAKAGKILGDTVSKELDRLMMSGAQFQVALKPALLKENGEDEAEFQLVAHPGATPRAVASSASGGELSRIMLAIEVSLASVGFDAGKTTRGREDIFVFDEIDAGIGGKAAKAVGNRLAELAQSAQVIIVTHLPQVAAYAGNHLCVVKETGSDFVRSNVEQLGEAERIEELARMLAGETSEVARAHAEQLLKESNLSADETGK